MRRPKWGQRTKHDTPLPDRIIQFVTVIDPTHPFYKRKLPVVAQTSHVGKEYVRVKLEEGSYRSILRSSTDMDMRAEQSRQQAFNQIQVSVGTLLSVAKLIAARQAAKELQTDESKQTRQTTQSNEKCNAITVADVKSEPTEAIGELHCSDDTVSTASDRAMRRGK